MKVMPGLFLLFICVLCGSYASADGKVEPPESCIHCGMSRAQFAHSRMLVEYQDGSTAGVCSLNCAAIELDNNRDRKIKSVLVADYNTGRLLEARSAHCVVGGEKKGVMTMLPKWAFLREEDAEQFMKQHGGRPAKYEEVLQLARENKKVSGMKKGASLDGHAPASEKKSCGCREQQ